MKFSFYRYDKLPKLHRQLINAHGQVAIDVDRELGVPSVIRVAHMQQGQEKGHFVLLSYTPDEAKIFANQLLHATKYVPEPNVVANQERLEQEDVA